MKKKYKITNNKIKQYTKKIIKIQKKKSIKELQAKKYIGIKNKKNFFSCNF